MSSIFLPGFAAFCLVRNQSPVVVAVSLLRRAAVPGCIVGGGRRRLATALQTALRPRLLARRVELCPNRVGF